MAATVGAATGQGADPMLPDPPLDFKSPRVRAAMRELGVVKADLEEQASPPPSPSPGSTMLTKSISDRAAGGALRERKRRELRQQVAALAARTERKRFLPRATTALDQQLSLHTAHMDRMQRVAKQGVQDLVLKELDRSLTLKTGDQKVQDSKAAALKFMKECEEKRKADQKATEKKYEKMQESIQKARLREDEHRQEVREKLEEALERNARNQAKLESERQETTPLWNWSRSEVLRAEREQKVMREEAQLRRRQRELMQRFEMKHKNKEQRSQEEIEKKRRAAQETSSKAAEKLAQYLEENGDEAAEDEVRRQTEEKLKQAQAKREAKVAEVKKECAAKNAKVESTHAKALESLMAQQAEAERELADSVTKKLERTSPWPLSSLDSSAGFNSTGSLTSMSRSFSSGFSIETLRRREEHRQIAAQNRERLARQEMFSQQKQRRKFDQMLQRAKMMQERQKQAARLRQDLQRNCITERDNLTFEFQRTKSAPPSKMVPLIERLRPDAGAVKQMDQTLRKLGVERPGPGGEEEDEK